MLASIVARRRIKVLIDRWTQENQSHQHTESEEWSQQRPVVLQDEGTAGAQEGSNGIHEGKDGEVGQEEANQHGD
jgi:hypothetical protein